MHRPLVGFAVTSFLALAAPAHGAEVTLWAQGTPTTAASHRLMVPADLVSVTYDRRVTGPGYVATAGAELERLDTATTLDGVFTGPASGRELLLTGAAVTLRSAALTVDDRTPPLAEVSLPNRASGTLTVPVTASDAGVGLERVVATIDGTVAATAAFGACAELTPADATIDRALGADCPGTGKQTLSIDTTTFANGERDLRIRTLDAAGNRQDFLWGLQIENAVVAGTGTVTPEPTPIVQGPHVRPEPSPTPSPTPEGGILSDQAVRYTTRDFLRIPRRPRLSKAGTLTLIARCPLTKPCALRVTLTRSGRTLGRGRVTVKPGKTKKLTIKLRRRGEMRVTVAGYPGVVIRVR